MDYWIGRNEEGEEEEFADEHVRYRLGDEIMVVARGSIRTRVTQTPDGRSTLYRPTQGVSHRWTYKENIFDLPHGSSVEGEMHELDANGEPKGDPAVVQLWARRSGTTLLLVQVTVNERVHDTAAFVYRGTSRLPQLICQQSRSRNTGIIMGRRNTARIVDPL